ncbi:hypothetical protein QFC22_005184 [Naganishia vaughanmartiniae]|uniref:Uncharacterized protein n=1 Tax=Naganishia vaughanmartiniae TaxID=1424756 RepID=A0ACC2WY76_9TREE|nr:hypothetical protein QFC22_005184 [Naganishia vaughanmartiniae]
MSGLSIPQPTQAEGPTTQADAVDIALEGAHDTALANDTNPSAPPPDGPVATKRKITRSRIGCFTCRRRKKACDLGKPVCQGCTRLGLDCQWPMNYQDTLPKKRVAEALAAADRSGGRSETQGSAVRSRSGSRSRVRDLKHEPNVSSPAERNTLHRGDSGSTSRVSNEQGHSPPSRRLSVAGSAYEDDSWLFPERMSYIHGDPEDMFDIYDESLASLPAGQQTSAYGHQHTIPQNFTSHLQHRFSGPGFAQLYAHGQTHPSMLQQAVQPSLSQFPVAQNGPGNLNNQIPLGYGDALTRVSQNGAPNSALEYPPVAKGFSNGQTHDTGLVAPLSNTGLALTVDQSHSQQHNQYQHRHLHQSNADVSANISRPELNNVKNLEWNHPSRSGSSASVNLEDPLMQLLAGGSYQPLHAGTTAHLMPHQAQRQENFERPQEEYSRGASALSVSAKELPVQISAHDFESSFVPSHSLSAETSLWSGLNGHQHRLRTQILEYYTHTLSKLVSCDHIDQEERQDAPETAPGGRRAAGFDVFRSLASSSATLLEPNTGDSNQTPLPDSGIYHGLSPISGESPESSPAHILHMALLAWSGRHSLNRGEVRHEASSEEWGKRAESMLARLMNDEEKASKDLPQAEKHPSGQSAGRLHGDGFQREGNGADVQSNESGHVAYLETDLGDNRLEDVSMLTTLAACLMVVQWKNCRGDISGFQSIMARVKALPPKVFFQDQKRPVPGTMEFHFMENLLYKDVLSTSIYVNEPILNQEALKSYFRQQPTVINTLTGLAWPIFTTMYRIAGLIRKKRERATASAREGNAWRYDELVDLVSEAEKIQQDLDTEKRLIDEVIEIARTTGKYDEAEPSGLVQLPLGAVPDCPLLLGHQMRERTER